MRYDLDLIAQLCDELGLKGLRRGDSFEIDLGRGDVLVFQNAERDEDCLMAFDGTPWHVHDRIVFSDRAGHYAELDYLDVVAGLVDGRLLVCEERHDDAVVEKRLVHRDFNDEFKLMSEGEELRIRRPTRTLRP